MLHDECRTEAAFATENVLDFAIASWPLTAISSNVERRMSNGAARLVYSQPEAKPNYTERIVVKVESRKKLKMMNVERKLPLLPKMFMITYRKLIADSFTDDWWLMTDN